MQLLLHLSKLLTHFIYIFIKKPIIKIPFSNKFHFFDGYFHILP
ncbi:predicted protein [Listeria monocytogenes J2818]|nr:predicted protein [Listeria monocytogenes J2818]